MMVRVGWSVLLKCDWEEGGDRAEGRSGEGGWEKGKEWEIVRRRGGREGGRQCGDRK